MGATIAVNLVPSVLKKKYFQQKWIKITSVYGVQVSKVPFFKKFGLKNPLIPTVSILGPALKSESYLPKKIVL